MKRIYKIFCLFFYCLFLVISSNAYSSNYHSHFSNKLELAQSIHLSKDNQIVFDSSDLSPALDDDSDDTRTRLIKNYQVCENLFERKYNFDSKNKLTCFHNFNSKKPPVRIYILASVFRI